MYFFIIINEINLFIYKMYLIMKIIDFTNLIENINNLNFKQEKFLY